MKEQEKQIKEMVKEIGNTWLVDLEGNTKDVCEVLDEVDINNIARELYDKNYRKLPEDSVVLSREEYKKLKSLPNKIVKYMDRHLGNGELCGNVVRNCAKQFGVKIKENNNEW